MKNQFHSDPIRRINVIGTSCSGKSIFSRRLAQALAIPYVQMDQLYWGPNWYEPPDEEFFPKLKDALSGDKWVLDGNYTKATNIKWERVQMAIWLDLPFYLVFFRAVKRSFIRAATKQEIWTGTGNRESFRKMFFSRDSMIWWVLKTYSPNRKSYNQMMNDKQFSHIRFVRLSSTKEVELFLTKVDNGLTDIGNST